MSRAIYFLVAGDELVGASTLLVVVVVEALSLAVGTVVVVTLEEIVVVVKKVVVVMMICTLGPTRSDHTLSVVTIFTFLPTIWSPSVRSQLPRYLSFQTFYRFVWCHIAHVAFRPAP